MTEKVQETREERLKGLRTEFEKVLGYDVGFPENSDQARSCMRCYLDMNGLRYMIGPGDADVIGFNQDRESYRIVRAVAIIFDANISDFPEELTQTTRGEIGVIGIWQQNTKTQEK